MQEPIKPVLMSIKPQKEEQIVYCIFQKEKVYFFVPKYINPNCSSNLIKKEFQKFIQKNKPLILKIFKDQEYDMLSAEKEFSEIQNYNDLSSLLLDAGFNFVDSVDKNLCIEILDEFSNDFEIVNTAEEWDEVEYSVNVNKKLSNQEFKALSDLWDRRQEIYNQELKEYNKEMVKFLEHQKNERIKKLKKELEILKIKI